MIEAYDQQIKTSIPDRGRLWSTLYESLKYIRRHNTHCGVLLVEMGELDDVRGILGDHGLEDYFNAMGQRVQKCLWDLDVAVRFEHNQFVIVANSIRNQQDIHIVLTKALDYLTVGLEIDGKKIEPSVRIGVVLLPEDATESDEIIENAQAAIKLAKDTYRSYCYFNQDLGNRIAEQEKIKNSILATLAEESFLLMLQPKVSTENKHLCGIEALVRMRDSDGNITPPGDFIPVAENSNLILEIGEWVLGRVMTLVATLREQGIDVPISVNISDTQFKNSAALLYTLHKLAAKDGANPNDIILEISENTITDDVVTARALMSEIKSLGYQISIDGFGAGFSSLTVLKDLTVDEIKIDRHFLDDVPTDEKNTAIVKSIVMLGKALNFRVVAMGVEREEQQELLRRHDCDAVQGFLVSKPLDHDDFISWYKGYNPS